jgi:predicted proteasome-type protease
VNVSALREIALAAQGALAVAQCHLQLAKHRVSQEDRIAHDHLDTAIVFQDSATAVIAAIHEMIQQVGRDSRATISALSSPVAGAA